MKKKFQRNLISLITPRFKIEYLKEDPDFIEKRKVYIIGDYGFPWRAILRCPCGCKDILYLNLDGETFPSWVFFDKKNIPTIKPSVNRQKGCKAHFFLTNGKIRWVN